MPEWEKGKIHNSKNSEFKMKKMETGNKNGQNRKTQTQRSEN